MKKNLKLFGLLFAAALFAAGCSQNAKSASEKPAAPAPTAAAANKGAVANVNGGTGKVLETLNSGGYTYVKADIGGAAVWAAAPKTTVKVGDVVTIPPGLPMRNFHSSTLNRTFDLVYFVARISSGAEGKGAAGAPASPPPQVGSAVVRPPAVEVKGIAKAKGGKTVAEVYADKAALSGKEVKVRGKVVKVSSGILGKNWVHVQDGTGKAGSNDLTVTTDAVVAVGDTVLVKGKVTADKDLGYGYHYAVIVENGQVTKE